MLLAQKLRTEISYEAEVHQVDVQVGSVPMDLVGFLQEGGWESIPDEDEPEATDDEGATRGDKPALRASVAITKFEFLDPALNDAFEAYLRECGVDGALAGFVPRYALGKELRVSAVCVLLLVLESEGGGGGCFGESEKEKGEWEHGPESEEAAHSMCGDLVR
ncbi:hypothetical protein DFH08DRAFT_975101 [Mycena albidolilacea]|uniref:Uncharacterized protein n=1 Tax=Mycena albidolilacea TaxID=1033008 RepID=A0AAD6Z5I4_9AGAR|nr:hypothetical protein DFH08DRAFT_975101 [Mycena albidolilacea]